MYYVLKVGSQYLGIDDNGAIGFTDRQQSAFRFDRADDPVRDHVRFVKVTPRMSPADVLPDDAAVQEQIHADIDATTRASDTLSSWENVPLGAPSACRNR